MAQIVLEESLSNPDADITISRKQWTVDTHQLYLLITRSASFLLDMQLFFETATLSSTQTTIGVETMIRIYKRVVQAAADMVTEKLPALPFVSTLRRCLLRAWRKSDMLECGQ